MEKKRRIIRLGFGLYAAVLLVLLFDRTPYAADGSYWQQLAGNLNLVPFRTILEFARLLLYRRNPLLIPYAIVNLLGNVAVFVPLGMFLPALWPRLRSRKAVTLWAAAGIICIELVQLFTLRGSCDIDDLILNLLGTELGFTLWKAWRRFSR